MSISGMGQGRWRAEAGKVTAGLAESNGSLSLSLHYIPFLSIAMSITIHKWTLIGRLVPRVGRTDVGWSPIRINGSQPRVIGSSWVVSSQTGTCESLHGDGLHWEHCTQCDLRISSDDALPTSERGGHPDTALTSVFDVRWAYWWVYDWSQGFLNLQLNTKCTFLTEFMHCAAAKACLCS